MEPELKLHLNGTGKYRSEYLTFALQNLGKLDSYKDLIFHNINKSILSRVEKLENLKSRINRIRAILPILNGAKNAMTIKSKKYYPTQKHKYYKYLNLEEKPEDITNLINSNYNCNNPNIPIINIKKPLVGKPESNNNVLGKIPRETFDDCISSQLLSNMQKKVRDLASELYELRMKNIGSSLVNELNDLVYEKTNYLETSFDFMNKKLIQKADLLWKVDKDYIELNQKINYKQLKKEEEEEDEQFSKNPKKPQPKLQLQEAPKSIKSKVKIEKYENKKIRLKATGEIQFNLPTSINSENIRGIAELQDEINEETPNVDENINTNPEREELELDYENQNDINNINLDDDLDFLPVNIIIRKNLENMKNEGNININSQTPKYSYQTANTSNINNTANNININVINNNYNNNSNNNIPQVSNNISSGNIVVVSGRGPGVPPPPPPPPPPPAVPVKKIVAKESAKPEGEEENKINEEPKKELSMAEQLASIKLKKVGTVEVKEVPKNKAPIANNGDLLRQQIKLRFEQLRQHEDKNDEEEEDDEFDN